MDETKVYEVTSRVPDEGREVVDKLILEALLKAG